MMMIRQMKTKESQLVSERIDNIEENGTRQLTSFVGIDIEPGGGYRSNHRHHRLHPLTGLRHCRPYKERVDNSLRDGESSYRHLHGVLDMRIM